MGQEIWKGCMGMAAFFILQSYKLYTDFIPVDSLANSLMIYNTTEDCYNYYSKIAAEWQSLCGGMAKAVYTVACSDISYNGVYVQKTALNGNNYLSIKANVTKAGNYSITGTTANGYGFSTQGVFLNPECKRCLFPDRDNRLM